MFKYSEYGKGKDKSEKWWREFIRLLIANEYICEKAISNSFNCTLDLHPDAYDFITNEGKLELDVSKDFIKL